MYNIGNRTTPQFNMPPVTLDVFVEKYLIWTFVNSINPYLLSVQNIASFASWRQHSKSAAIFVYNGAFDIPRSVRNVSCVYYVYDIERPINTQILHANILLILLFTIY